MKNTTENIPTGWLNINKESGITSHDLVSKVRRALKTKKVGHAGTLDPMATGVMTIAVGKATRLIQFLEETKAYIGEIHLGVTTDTLDAHGKIISQKEVNTTNEIIIETVNKFSGKIKQIPPMVSAVHHEGVRLYELARKGIEVERKAREVEIYQIKVLNINLPFVTIEVHCQSGTYIRTIANDIGDILGCGASLSKLQRIESNNCFNISESKEIENISVDDLIDFEYPIAYLPVITLGDEEAQKYLFGQHLTGFTFNGFSRIKDNNQKFLGIAYSIENKLIPKINFVD